MSNDIPQINVLDHGYVRLVDYMGSDLSVVRAARVSYDAAWRSGADTGSDQRLINYLWRNKHTSPFEAVTFTFEVKAPLFVLRQWHRHRTWSYNEVSARYTALPDEFYLPAIDVIGIQATKNKQGRETDTDTDLLNQRGKEREMLEKSIADAYKTYTNLLEVGWPRELARSVLPVSIYSTMFATVNLLNLFKFLTLRCDSHAQYEIRRYAEALRELGKTVAPVSFNAWETY